MRMVHRPRRTDSRGIELHFARHQITSLRERRRGRVAFATGGVDCKRRNRGRDATATCQQCNRAWRSPVKVSAHFMSRMSGSPVSLVCPGTVCLHGTDAGGVGMVRVAAAMEMQVATSLWVCMRFRLPSSRAVRWHCRRLRQVGASSEPSSRPLRLRIRCMLPREVVLWNWRRITLMGISIALAVGAQFSCALLLLLALGFMWWAVPHRRPAALAILLSACVVALFLLWGSYLFRPGAMLHGFAGGHWIGFSTAAVTSSVMYRLIGTFYMRDAAASTLMFLVALLTYFAWRRTRFFGNTAPLLAVMVLLFLAVTMPQVAGFTFVFLCAAVCDRICFRSIRGSA